MNIMIDQQQSEKAARLMAALSNPHRLRILCMLHEGEISVGDLQARIGVSQSNLSQQLSRLRADGLVRTRRDSQKIYYALANDDAMRIITVLHELYCLPQAKGSAART